MLTVDFDRVGVTDGTRLLDMGCGGGRHAFEAWRRGASVVALDYSEGELKDVRGVLGAMLAAGELPHADVPESSDRAAGTLRCSETGPERPGGVAAKSGIGGAVNGDALRLPFPDATFDVVIASRCSSTSGTTNARSVSSSAC